MILPKISGIRPRLGVIVYRRTIQDPLQSGCRTWRHAQTRGQHNIPRRSPQRVQQAPRPQTAYRLEPEEIQSITEESAASIKWPDVRVRYLRPAIWALVVSGGIFTGLAYVQAKQELKAKKSTWLEAPQWGAPRRGPPNLTQMWENVDPISKVSYGIIAANSAIHLSSFVLPHYWDLLWHIPARNVNYTLLSSAFVHSGPMHLFVNMYATYNFLLPVGYSRAFEGKPNHVLSFFLATGVLSGFAQHWATMITLQKRSIPEVFIRCGGASGALLGILGVFCMEYPHAGLGIIFLPFHFEAQYVLPAVMLFDFVGMVRGYSFVNFGHAAHLSGTVLGVAYSYFDGKNNVWNPLVQFWKRRLSQQ
ncbi:hypothetical protein DE146DRAFT_67738 [Phaeosphaeria sp. MPI-PUGE-AT-0046c]|nr:hypothetical protein DE146DRAFT_67738 [Phaeosphaeria sp. MPI-PUGE-AT-0046c]